MIVEERNLRELGDADDAAPLGETGLFGAEVVAALGGELAAEELTDEKPEVVLPVVKALKPGSLVDLFLRAARGDVAEAVQVREVG